VNGSPHDLLEHPGIRFGTRHQGAEGLLSVEQDKLPPPLRKIRIRAGEPELSQKRRAVVRRCRDQDAFPSPESLRQVVAHMNGQAALVSPIQLHCMRMGGVISTLGRYRLCKGHEYSSF
jgi:hypothetical protein